jgi:hypothetical protein
MRKSLFRIARNHSLFPSLLVRGIIIENIMPINFSSEHLQQGGRIMRFCIIYAFLNHRFCMDWS